MAGRARGHRGQGQGDRGRAGRDEPAQIDVDGSVGVHSAGRPRVEHSRGSRGRETITRPGRIGGDRPPGAATEDPRTGRGDHRCRRSRGRGRRRDRAAGVEVDRPGRVGPGRLAGQADGHMGDVRIEQGIAMARRLHEPPQGHLRRPPAARHDLPLPGQAGAGAPIWDRRMETRVGSSHGFGVGLGRGVGDQRDRAEIPGRPLGVDPRGHLVDHDHALLRGDPHDLRLRPGVCGGCSRGQEGHGQQAEHDGSSDDPSTPGPGGASGRGRRIARFSHG